MRFVLLCALILTACESNEVTPTATAGYRDIEADQIVYDMEQYVTAAGRQRAVLRGDTAYVFEDSAKALIKNVNLTLFDDAGQESAQLTSREGDFHNATQAMLARGKVVLVTRGADSRTIESEELHYDPNTKRVWSTKATVMRSKDGTVVNGSGFESDDRFANVRITNARSTGGSLRIQF
jgi:LPS export ABC transporter protein LptC